MTESKENTPEKSAKKPTPSVLSINICDSIIRDEISKKVSLIGLFNTITASSFPCKHPQMHVYVALTNGHGKYKVEVRFWSLKEDKPIAGMVGDLAFQNPLQVVEMNMCWQGVEFGKPGDYAVQVLCESELIGDRKFRVIAPQQQMPPTERTEAR